MEIISTPAAERQVTFKLTIDELVEIHDAIAPGGRKSKAQQTTCENLCLALRKADIDLDQIIAGRTDESVS